MVKCGIGTVLAKFWAKLRVQEPKMPFSIRAKFVIMTATLIGLGACNTQTPATSMLPKSPSPYAASIAQTKDDLTGVVSENRVLNVMQDVVAGATSASDETMQSITGLGYSQVKSQPGKTLNERRLMAIRAARLEAMRDLTEQVHGIHITSQTTVGKTVINNDVINAKIEGVLRGARTVRITPKSSDTFEVVLELDPSTVSYIVTAARSGL